MYSTAACGVRRRVAMVSRSRSPGVLVQQLWLLLNRVRVGRLLIAGETSEQRDRDRVLECRERAIEAGCGIVETGCGRGGRSTLQLLAFIKTGRLDSHVQSDIHGHAPILTVECRSTTRRAIQSRREARCHSAWTYISVIRIDDLRWIRSAQFHHAFSLHQFSRPAAVHVPILVRPHVAKGFFAIIRRLALRFACGVL
jgi:hypothetical protein